MAGHCTTRQIEAHGDKSAKKIGKLFTDFGPPRCPRCKLFPSGRRIWPFLLSHTSNLQVLARNRSLCGFLAPRLGRSSPLWTRVRLSWPVLRMREDINSWPWEPHGIWTSTLAQALLQLCEI